MAPYACAQFRLPHIFPLRSLAAAPMAALLAGAALLWLLPTAAAHGMLAEPAARNVARNWQHCPHCVNGGGPYETSDHGRLRWPRTTQPPWGDPSLSEAGDPVETYEEGQAIDISLFITAHHGGRHTFRLCPQAEASEGCLAKYVLQRADGDGPHSWTATNGQPLPGGRHRAGSFKSLAGTWATFRYRLPAGVSCRRCVLQWTWTTANSCRLPGAPANVGSDPGMLRCDEGPAYPEEFRNVADISIKPASGDGDGGRRPAGERGERAASAAASAAGDGAAARRKEATTAKKEAKAADTTRPKAAPGTARKQRKAVGAARKQRKAAGAARRQRKAALARARKQRKAAARLARKQRLAAARRARKQRAAGRLADA